MEVSYMFVADVQPGVRVDPLTIEEEAVSDSVIYI